MPSYVLLGKYTPQGMSVIKDSPRRTESARKAIEAAGGRLGEFYLTMGQYDFVTVIEAPDDETLASVLLAIASSGNITTETLRAFSEEERRQIVSKMP